MLGDFIKSKRIENNLSQRELARRIGISNTSLNDLEKGKVRKTDILILIKLSNELNINIFKLLELSNYTKEEIFFLRGVIKYGK